VKRIIVAILAFVCLCGAQGFVPLVFGVKNSSGVAASGANSVLNAIGESGSNFAKNDSDSFNSENSGSVGANFGDEVGEDGYNEQTSEISGSLLAIETPESAALSVAMNNLYSVMGNFDCYDVFDVFQIDGVFRADLVVTDNESLLNSATSLTESLREQLACWYASGNGVMAEVRNNDEVVNDLISVLYSKLMEATHYLEKI